MTQGNLTSFEWVVLSKWEEAVGILFLWVGHFSSNGDLAMTIIRNIFPGRRGG